MGQGLSPHPKLATPVVQKSIAAASISSTYQLVTSKFGGPLIQLIIVSTLDQDVQLSLDGVNDWMPMVAGGTFIADEASNLLCIAGWRGIYVKEIGNPTTGSLYVTGFLAGA